MADDANLNEFRVGLLADIRTIVTTVVEEAEKRITKNVDERIEKVRHYVDERIATSEKRVMAHVDERTYDVETKLLRAFADFNTSNSIRLRKIEADASNLNTSSTLRFDIIESRLAALEAKFILNPPEPPQPPLAS